MYQSILKVFKTPYVFFLPSACCYFLTCFACSIKYVTSVFWHQTENEASLKEMRSLRERLHMSERAAEGLKSDLSAMIAQRDHGQAELHQARLQAAQLTLQLADSSLALREGKAQWAQERQKLQLAAEVGFWYGIDSGFYKDPFATLFLWLPQISHDRLEKLNSDMLRVEERLQEEKMERVKLEVELGREKDCNRVRRRE